MTLKFYYAPFSTASVTGAVLAELEHGHPEPLAERIEISLQKGDTRSPEYLTGVNPNGLVPAIVHHGVPIWESAAITMYLGETFGVDRSLYPALGVQRGEAMKWIVWSNVNLATHASRLYSLVKSDKPGDDETEAQAEAKRSNGEAARKGVEDALHILDAALDGRDYLLGDTYCLADTHVWSFTQYISMLKVDLDKFPGIKAWSGRVGSRPALKKAV
ncbi:glutathione S-transferase [Metarhizium rileyi]|uniref:Glutathione S-transferase n=1 Tax=Metarhizium rileyi (strain RCEF 4871) TaxID=1649241 RepID=A0A167JIH7_METRR|nr:glutathione S-transferase [Metarhizium rileyi RCEF 4871]